LGYFGAVADISADDVERIVAPDLTVLIDLTRPALTDMVRQGGGDVLVTRVPGIARLVALPPHAQPLELGLRAAGPALVRLGTAIAIARAPRAAAERDVWIDRPLEVVR
jgi:hypothetical protein